MISKRIESLSPYKTETTIAKVRLSSNELSIDFPDYIKERIAKEVAKIPFNKYPDPHARELKQVISQKIGVNPENIVLGNGSDELIYYLSIAIGEFDRGVFYPVPTFPMYQISAKILGREPVEVKLDKNFDIDLEESIKAIQEKQPALAYLSYPNNPTGNCFSKEKVEKICSLNLFCVIDEAYFNYSKKSFLDQAIKKENMVVLRTLSKIGMAGLRVGILIAKEEIAYEINKMRLPFNITYPSQVIAKLLLTEFYDFIQEKIQRVIQERDRVYNALLSFKELEVFPSEANFILFRTKSMKASDLHKKLLHEGILIRDMSHILDNALRVSIGEPEENDAFLEALSKVLC